MFDLVYYKSDEFKARLSILCDYSYKRHKNLMSRGLLSELEKDVKFELNLEFKSEDDE